MNREERELYQMQDILNQLASDVEKIKKTLEKWRLEIEDPQTPCPIECCETCEGKQDCTHDLTKKSSSGV